jgi:polyisoprenoid-binding protein YceI
MKASSYLTLPLAILLTAAGLTTTALGAENFNLDTAHSYLLFKVQHLGLANSYGRFNDITGTIVFDADQPANSRFSFSVAAESVDTGNDKRDQHLRSGDFFDVANHPTITFESRRVKPLGGDRFEVEGDITLLGNTRSVTAEVVQTGAGKDPWGNHRRGFETQFTFRRSEYGMDHLLKAVSDQVVITVSVEGMRKP